MASMAAADLPGENMANNEEAAAISAKNIQKLKAALIICRKPYSACNAEKPYRIRRLFSNEMTAGWRRRPDCMLASTCQHLLSAKREA